MQRMVFMMILLCLLAENSQAVKIGMRYDEQGNFINPDDYLVFTALEADKGGYKNDAKWRLRDAAEFGNKHAQYFMGLLLLQEDDKINGLAWMKLAGQNIGNNNHLMAALEKQLTVEDLSLVDDQLQQLKLTYNFESAIERRARWKKSLSYGGTHIKGHVPIGWKAKLNNGKMIFANEVKHSLEAFVFEYRYDSGEVSLSDFEVIEANQ